MSERRRLLVLSGPTREPIDPVRYLSNASSGSQGLEIVAEGLSRGHRVDLVTGPVHRTPPEGARVVRVTTALEMLERARELHPSCDVLVGAAAVSDYRPARPLERKHKRGTGPGDVWTLELVPNPDVLALLGEAKGERVHVGFALETEDLVANARAKLARKHLDWIVANGPEAVGAERASYRILGAGGSDLVTGSVTKRELAARLLDLVEAGLGTHAAR